MREEHFPPPSPAVCAVTSQFGRPPRILLPTGSDFQMLGFAIMISCKKSFHQGALSARHADEPWWWILTGQGDTNEIASTSHLLHGVLGKI